MQVIQENPGYIEQNYFSNKPLSAINIGQRSKYRVYKDGILSENKLGGSSK